MQIICCGRSAASDAHMPFDSRTRRANSELMALGLAGEQSVQCFRYRLAAASAQKIAQLDVLIVDETAKDRSRRRHPDTVASIAKVVGERSDEPEADAETFDLKIARRPAGAGE